MNKVIAFTDGGCEPNPGVGGWGVVLVSGERRKELHGGEPDTTNNAMELTAALMALRALKQPCEVEIVSDSQYLVFTMTKDWHRNKNIDLWDALDAACEGHTVLWSWQRGHVGHEGNERAHVLSMMGIRETRRKSA